METKHGIPQKELDEIVKRDTNCAYCGKKMIYPWNSKNRSDSATIEHLNHKKDWESVSDYVRKGWPVAEIIVICCGSCNYSRRDKSLRDWFKKDYCKGNNSMNKKIDEESVGLVVREYIDKYEKGNEKI
jgi:hypothetical protein